MISPVTITFACVGILVVFLAVFVVLRNPREDDSKCSNTCKSCKCEEPRSTNAVNRTASQPSHTPSHFRASSSVASRNSNVADVADDAAYVTSSAHNGVSSNSSKSHTSWSSHCDSSSYSSSDSSSSCSDSSSSCSSGCD